MLRVHKGKRRQSRDTYVASIFDIFDIDSITFKENENDFSDIFDMSHTLYSVRITM